MGQITTNFFPTLPSSNGALLGVSVQLIFVGEVPFLVLNEIGEDEKVAELVPSCPIEPLKIFFPEVISMLTYPGWLSIKIPAWFAALQIEDRGW